VPAPEPAREPLHRRSLIQLIGSSLGILLVLAFAGLFLIMGVSPLLGGTPLRQADPLPFSASAACLFFAVLLIPSLIYSWRRLRLGAAYQPVPLNWLPLRYAIWAWPIVLLLGVGALRVPLLSLTLLPVLHVLAISIPILWMLSLGARRLNALSPPGIWAAVAVGILLTPVVIIVIEGFLSVLLGGVIVGLLADSPGFLGGLRDILAAFTSAAGPDLSTVLIFVERFLLSDNRILGLGIAFIAVLVPIVEELLKPLGLLFLGKRNLTPATGFVAGMISGAAFALFESIFQIAPGSEWALLAAGRMGTSAVHIFNSGLVGWALAMIWRERRLGRGLLLTLLAMAIHGIWNGVTGLILVATLPRFSDLAWLFGAVIILPIIGLLCTLGLGLINRKLYKQQREKLWNSSQILSTSSAI
jgi:hypothetical protein